MEFPARPMTMNTVREPVIRATTGPINMSVTERRLSMIGAAALGLIAVQRKNIATVPLALASLTLLYQALTGKNMVYEALNKTTAVISRNHTVSVPHKQGIHVVESISVDRPRAELYQYWRNLANMPEIFSHLDSVEVLSNGRSYWVTKGVAGMNIEWEAEIHNEVENEVIAWRSIDDATVPNAGSVRFKDAPGDHGTMVVVTMEYAPPGGKLANAVASMFMSSPNEQIGRDLRRFKQMMELGEVVSNESPHGRRSKFG